MGMEKQPIQMFSATLDEECPPFDSNAKIEYVHKQGTHFTARKANAS